MSKPSEKEIIDNLTYVIDEVSTLHKHIYEYDDIYDSYVEDICDKVDEIKNQIRKVFVNHTEPLQWKDLTFSKEPTYIKATLNNVMVTLKCWEENSKEWCVVNFDNAPCNNMLLVHHGYDDITDTQPILFDALGFIIKKGNVDNEELD